MSLPFFRTKRISAQGNALVPILLIIAALAVSAAVFFVFTKKRMDVVKAAQTAEAAAQAEQALKSETAPALPPPAMTPVPTASPAPAPVLGFARPADVAVELARNLSGGDMASAAKILSAGDPALESATAAVLEKMKELGFKAAPSDQVKLLGQADNAMRLSIPLQKLDGTSTDARIMVDIVKDPKMGWKVGTLRLPKELEVAVAAMPAPAAGAKPLMVVDATPDALTFASDFVQALLKPDYDKARKLVDEEKVPSVKLAGLCIVFEDGQFELQPGRPLMTTVATENTSWIIAKVESATMKEATEFGMEMEKTPAGWRVIGLNLSQLLGDSAKASSSIGVPYTPLVKNPKGGDSIALYYEYDQATLHPRAQKQLAIVADILKSNPGKKLRIGGYTDAKGSDVYNLDLSKKRADAVRQFFTDQGVPADQVETNAFGKADPLGPNANPDGTDNPEGRSLNRRAEILLDF